MPSTLVGTPSPIQVFNFNRGKYSDRSIGLLFSVPAQGPTLDTRFAVRQATPPVLPPDISPANLAPPTPTGEDPPVPTEG